MIDLFMCNKIVLSLSRASQKLATALHITIRNVIFTQTGHKIVLQHDNCCVKIKINLNSQVLIYDYTAFVYTDVRKTITWLNTRNLVHLFWIKK